MVSKKIIANNNERLDVCLSKHFKQDYSRVEMQDLIKNGKVKVNNIIVGKPSFCVKNKDVVDISFEPKVKDTFLQPKEMKIDIVFENENLLVINKPVGLTVHPGAGNKNNTLVNGLLDLQNKGKITLSNERGFERVGVVHRLDRDTSGLMIIAKHNKAHRLLAELIKNHEIDRRYLALVHGVPVPPIGRIEECMCRDKKCIQRMKICQKDDDGAKFSATNYKILKVVDDGKKSVVECKLETGRTHQIRLHFQSIKHPLVGEQIYTQSNLRQIDLNEGYTHQMLHSYKLSFNDPVNGERIELVVLSEIFATIL